MKADHPVGTGESRRHSLLGAAALTYAANGGAAVLSLVNVLVVARTLGPAGRGDVAFLIAVAALGASVSSFGIQEANANIGGLDVAARPHLASNSLLFAAAFGSLLAVLAGTLSWAFSAGAGDVDRRWLVVALASIPIVLVKFYLQYLVQAEYAFNITNLAWIVGPLTTAVTNGLLAAFGVLSVGTAITAWTCGQLLGAVILVIHVLRHSGFGRPDAKLARESLRFGVRVHLGSFMALGNYRVDQFFVGVMAGSTELGHYSVAVAWAEVLFYIPGVLVLVQRPDLVRATGEQAAHQATQIFRYALLVAGAVSAVLIVLAPFLCTFVFGPDFSASVGDLRILALAGSGIVALELLGNALTAQRRPMLTTSAIAVAFAVTLVLDLLLIPHFGGAGAAAATAIAWTVGGMTAIAIFRRVFPAPWSRFVPTWRDLAAMWATARAQLVRLLASRHRVQPSNDERPNPVG